MDELGVDIVGIGEHHTADYAVSAPQMLLGALASVTKNIKLSSAASLLTTNCAVKLYQDFATLDLLSNGRIELMLGKGAFEESFDLFGSREVFGEDLENYKEVFYQKLELLDKINHQKEPLSWDNQYNRALDKEIIYPRAQKPLDIWLSGGGNVESARKAGTLGYPFVIGILNGKYSNYKEAVYAYKEAYNDAGHDISKMQIASHSPGLLRGDASILPREIMQLYKSRMNLIGSPRDWEPYTSYRHRYSSSELGCVFVGRVEQIVDKILLHKQEFGLTRFCMHMDFGGPSHLAIMKSIELFGDKVIPQIRKHLEEEIYDFEEGFQL